MSWCARGLSTPFMLGRRPPEHKRTEQRAGPLLKRAIYALNRAYFLYLGRPAVAVNNIIFFEKTTTPG